MRSGIKKALAVVGFAPTLSPAWECCDRMERSGRCYQLKVDDLGVGVLLDVAGVTLDVAVARFEDSFRISAQLDVDTQSQ